MAMTCRELFEGIDCTFLGNADEPVSGIAYRSDAVTAGDAFFCIVGTNVDGHSFAQDAINHGARVIVAQRKVYLADATDVVEIIVSDTRRAMARTARQLRHISLNTSRRLLAEQPVLLAR